MTLNQLKIIGVVIFLLLAGFVAERYLLNRAGEEPEPGTSEINFTEEGYIFRNNPGMKPGVWYLSYEKPGQSGLSAELKFGSENSDLQVGQRVKVQGNLNNGLVEVSSLDILNAYKTNLIWVDTPRPGQTVINPITVTGFARGSWYFEASFPIKVLDANGKVLGQTAAQAQGNWMTTEYVQFMASLSYTQPSTATGTIVLEKDNPSGLPENSDELRIPVNFGVESRTVKLYYYNPEKDKDASGNILASRQGLIAVNRQIPITMTPIQDTIKLLLQGNLTAAEKEQGITTEYPLPGFELKSADLKNGILTLEFVDPQNKTGGGSARVGILWFQIESTAKQFPGVSQVKFIPEELFQP